MKFFSLFICLCLFLFSGLTDKALAHVIVKPNEVAIGSLQTFVLSVPSERELPTTEVKLQLPNGVTHVTPTVKSGWSIEVKKMGEGESAKAVEILWTGGEIPAGQRDEFSFSAQVPAKTATLRWKAHQTYQDGSIMSWDKEAETNDEEEEGDRGPYSTTLVVDDLQPVTNQTTTQNPQSFAITMSIIALAVAVIAFRRSVKKK